MDLTHPPLINVPGAFSVAQDEKGKLNSQESRRRRISWSCRAAKAALERHNQARRRDAGMQTRKCSIVIITMEMKTRMRTRTRFPHLIPPPGTKPRSEPTRKRITHCREVIPPDLQPPTGAHLSSGEACTFIHVGVSVPDPQVSPQV